jgi:hypothetical protein
VLVEEVEHRRQVLGVVGEVVGLQGNGDCFHSFR